MERRFSLSINSPRLANPMADSTWIDGPPTANRSTTFQLSPKQQRNSSICLSSSFTKDMTPNKTLHQTSGASTSISRMTRQKLNLSHIDPKTYADVHSSGLASRIVKYHQQSRSSGLQRSISFNNVYNPITQSRRTSITASHKHKPNLPSLSMTQIAPPERSFYCGNTLPSLLRSNSLLGIEKCTEQLSRENRPIMHPQPLQLDSEPTRSVLEELKEISRKRINSGDIQQNDYSTKKSCNRVTDFVDHNSFHTQQQQMSMLQSQSGFKRQRELTISVPQHQHHAPMALTLQQHHQQNLQTSFANNSSPQQSPEQLAKRRNCSYSNDIISSLSSSKLHTNKRKLFDSRQKLRLDGVGIASTADARGSSSSPEGSHHQHASKIQRKQPMSDVRLENLTKTQSTPITPLPATPSTTAMPAQRTVSAPALPHEEAPPRPKLTLFNAQQLQRNEESQSLDLESPDVDAGEYAGIQFVKPKQQNSFNGVKNSNLERTQKTKLALMLSSLKGEIYQDEADTKLNDEPDAKLQPSVITTATTKAAVTAVTTTTTSATSAKPVILSVTSIKPALDVEATTTATTVAGTPNASKTTPLASLNNPATTTNDSATSMHLTASGTHLKLPTATTSATATSSTTPLLTFSSPKSVDTIEKAATTMSSAAPNVALAMSSCKLPTTTTISFGNITQLTATNTNTVITTTSTTTTTKIAATTPLFSFGNSATTAVSTSATTTEQTTLSMFSFGNAVTAAATTAIMTHSTFSFGNVSTNNVLTTAPASATTPTFKAELGGFNSENKINFSGGLKAITVASPLAATNNVAEPAKMFSFGTSTVSATAAPTPATPKPMFGQPATTPNFGQAAATAAATAAPTQQILNKAATTTPFSFNSSATTTTPSEAGASNNSSLFTFGGTGNGAVSKPVAKAAPFTLPSSNNAFSFGGGSTTSGNDSKPPTVTQPTNNFSFNATQSAPPAAEGNTSTFSFNATPKQTPIFGGSTANTNAAAVKPFTFGGSTEQQQPQPPASAAGGATQTPREGGFSFAAMSQKPETTNLFGSPAATPTAATGVVKPSFSFGGNSTKPTATAGTPVTTFGNFAKPAAPANKPFTFGGAASNAVPQMGGNLFANAVAATQQQQQQQQQPTPGGFSFSSANNNSSTVAASPANNSNAPFAFGSIASAPPSNTAKPFTFGSSANVAPTPNIFGNAGSQAAPSNTAAFNFGGTTSSAPDITPTAQQLNSGNVFALPNTPEGRPIRRATRRLQK